LSATVKISDRKIVILEKAKGKTVTGKNLSVLNLDAKEEGVFITAATVGRAKYTHITAYYKTINMSTKKAIKINNSKAKTGASKSLKEVYSTEQLAKKAATAELAQLNRDSVEITLNLPGNEAYKAEYKLH
jgi:phage protein D